MFRRMVDWFNEQRQWKADHIRTWEGMTTPGPSGVSTFQELALTTIKSLGIHLPFQQMGEADVYFIASIPGTEARVFTFRDGAQVIEHRRLWGDRFLLRSEEWDHRTPEELIKVLASVISEHAHAI